MIVGVGVGEGAWYCFLCRVGICVGVGVGVGVGVSVASWLIPQYTSICGAPPGRLLSPPSVSKGIRGQWSND